VKSFLTFVVLLLAVAGAQAQDPPADGQRSEATRRPRAPLATPDDLEPAVDVGRTRLAVADPPAAPGSAAATPGTPGAPAANAVAPAPVGTQASPPGTPTPSAAPRPGNPRVLDSIDLGTTSITGNQELPKVLYIVPWKKSDLGDLVGRPVNTLLDEVLAPVDPEVFERHLRYYEALNGKQGQ
jgi:hypothetical protein